MLTSKSILITLKSSTVLFLKQTAFLEEMVTAMKGEGWYCSDDPMTDYFDRAYYTDIHIGKWDKAYIQTAMEICYAY